MNKLVSVFLAFVTLTVAASASAETGFMRRGNLYASGAAGLMGSSSEEPDGKLVVTEETLFVMKPIAGCFVIGGLLIGIAPSYEQRKKEIKASLVGGSFSDKEASSEYGFSALIRYYHLLTGSLFVFAGASGGYFAGTEEGENSTLTKDLKGFGVNGHAGIGLAFGEKLGGVAAVALFGDQKWMTNEPPGPKEGDYPPHKSDYTKGALGVMAELGVFFQP